MGAIRLKKLLELPVRVHGIRLGRPLEVLLDEQDRVVGIEVRCGDGEHRFLPFSVVEIREDEIRLMSALMLLGEADLAYYQRRARRIRATAAEGLWVDEDGLVSESQAAA